MRFDFAPMEGITGYIYRNAHHAWFGGMDRYFAPFLSPSTAKDFSSREKNDICPEHNEGICLIPQLLTNQAEVFLLAAEKLEQMGYQEVNLNLGCPSGTVVAKKKGSGFLAYPQELQAFLEEIFRKTPIAVSVKTRIGKENPDEFPHLLEIFNQYPIKELIIHPRVQKDMYKNTPNWESLSWAVQHSANPVCYNGDLFCMEDYLRFRERFPDVGAVMLGRGLLRNPALANQLRRVERQTQGSMQNITQNVTLSVTKNITQNIVQMENGQKTAGMDFASETEALRGFHNQVYHDYQKVMSGDRNVLFKMKEIWFYLSASFPGCEKEMKKIKKAEKCLEYERAVDMMFEKRAGRMPAE